ncbi:MAG TPA: hypothetical protein PLM74_11065 [Bacillota bacterium]|jgi:hypothetical protein|nr:hypothetical protein [Bacillota bacterium]
MATVDEAGIPRLQSWEAQHLKHILANLTAYRDALVANNPDPGKSGGWGDY